ncbi:MAG: DEAD/DEAH box helicase [Caulobacter sp.]|nr:DEAD/DEAH box helicase [Caulobacter sp.]
MTRTYGDLVRSGDRWIVSNLEPHVAIRFKALFSAVPKSAKVMTLGGDPAASADLAWFADRYPLRGEPADLAALEDARTRFGAMRAEAGRISAPDYEPPLFAGLRDGQAARPHQAKAARLVELFEGLLVGDQTGKGKTYTAGAAMLLPGALPATVVCPAGIMKRQWARKIEEFTGLKCHVVEGTTPYALPPCDVRIFSYSIIGGWADYLEAMGTGLAVFDEVHELRRGVGTDRDPVIKGVAAIRLARASRLRLGLTATPIFNYGSEIWQVMQFIRPEVLGEWPDFVREWCHSVGAGKWGVRDPAGLGAYLREQSAFVREVKDTPKVNVIVHELDGFDGEGLASIEDLARHLAHRATTAGFHERGEAVRELDMLVRHQTGVGKARAVAAFARAVVGGGSPLVLFGWHRDVYDIWLRETADLSPAMFTGSETPAAKMREIGRFLNGETDLLIMSLRSGMGVDGLQARASVVLFGELDWSPAMHEQCIGRLDRDGQPVWETGEGVTAVYLTVPDGSDPPIMEVLGLKASEQAHIVDPSLGVQARNSDEGRFRTLLRRYLDQAVAA